MRGLKTALLVLAVLCIGWGPMMLSVKPSSNPCPSGTYKFAWNGDYTGDTDKGCVNSGASAIDGTITGTTVHTDYGRTGNGVLITDDGDYIIWTRTGTDEIDTDIGTVCMWINSRADTANSNVFESRGDANDNMRFYRDATRNVIGTHQGNGNVVQKQSSGTVTHQVFTQIAFTWTVAGDAIAVSTDGGSSWTVDTDADTVTTFTTDSTTFVLGDKDVGITTVDDVWVDDFFILAGYQTSCP
jgi:hypothetical protein